MLPHCPDCGAPLHLWLTTRLLYCNGCEFTVTTGAVPGYVS